MQRAHLRRYGETRHPARRPGASRAAVGGPAALSTGAPGPALPAAGTRKIKGCLVVDAIQTGMVFDRGIPACDIEIRLHEGEVTLSSPGPRIPGRNAGRPSRTPAREARSGSKAI
jgi:hypothetical protein